MTTREDFGWRDDQERCPAWCNVGNHLEWRFAHRTDHYWHCSEDVAVRTTDFDHHDDPVDATAYLTAHVVVDERGYNTRPTEVSACGMTFTPDGARQLAGALVQLADAADGVSGENEARP